MSRVHFMARALRLAALLSLLLGFTSSVGFASPANQQTPRSNRCRSRPLDGQLVIGFRRGTGDDERARAHSLASATIFRRIPALDADVVRVAKGEESRALGVYQSLDSVRYADQDRVTGLSELSVESDELGIPRARKKARAGAAPNDPLLDEQYYLRQIDAIDARVDAGSLDKVTVAVLDTGVDLRHRDLKVHAPKGSNQLEPKEKPLDQDGHGTAVAGIIAARANNRRGIIGVAPNAALLMVKIADNGNQAAESDFAAGLVYAVDHGARVVNMSVATYDSQVVMDSIGYAVDHDLVLVAAAGNANSSYDSFSGPLPDVIAVGAVDSDDRKADFSNYGSGVALAAPGVGIRSLSNDGSYGYFSGTSFAAPQVTAAAAVLRGQHPDWSAEQVRDRLCQTADDTPGTGSYWTCGRLNLDRAVSG